jgi:hypothetical protein
MAITSRALAFASRWFDPQTVARVFNPLVADWQREWIETRRLTVHAKGILSFCIAMIVSTPALFHPRAPKALTDQIARRIAIATALGTAVLIVPFAREIQLEQTRGFLIVFVIPGALVMAFPFSMVSAVDAIRNFTGVEPHVVRSTAAKLAAVAVVFMLFMHGWVVPAANQAWREGTFHPPSEPARAPRELSIFELLTSPELAKANEPGTNEFYKARNIRREINNRAALAILPVLVVWRRWRALDLTKGRWFSARPAPIGTLAMIFAFLMLRFSHDLVEIRWHLPRGSSLWLTLSLLALFGVIRVRLAERTMVRA